MNNKHLTFDDRLAIQAGLQQGLKVARIAKNIGKDRATAGHEIKAHPKLAATSKGNSCVHHNTCTKIPEYQEEFCIEYEKSPFVCNACGNRLRCRLRRTLYDAKYAQEQYEKIRSKSRKGISLTAIPPGSL